MGSIWQAHLTLAAIVGALIFMVGHLWRWRRRCAPRHKATSPSPRAEDFIRYKGVRYYENGYVPFGPVPGKTRLVHIIDGQKMKTPAAGDPGITIPERAFFRLLVAPNWLTPDKYPTSVKLSEGEIGCLLSHEGAVRVRVREEDALAQKHGSLRTFNDRIAELVLSFIHPEHWHGKVLPHGMSEMSLEEFCSRYEDLDREWLYKGCPDYY